MAPSIRPSIEFSGSEPVVMGSIPVMRRDKRQIHAERAGLFDILEFPTGA